MKFKVGDTVKVVNTLDMYYDCIGTIKAFSEYEFADYLVEFENGACWNYSESELWYS